MANTKENKELDNYLKLLVKSSFIIFIGIFISKILAYFYRIVIAREFGPEIYGIFSLAIMIMAWFITIFSLGIIDGIIRFISIYRGKNEKDKIKYLVKLSSTFLLISGIIAGLIMYFSASYISINLFHNENLISFIKWLGIFLPVYLFASFFLSVLQAYEKITWYSFIRNILDNGIKLLAIIIFIWIGFNSKNAVIYSYILGFVSMFLLSFYLCTYKIPELFKKYKLKSEDKNIIRKDLFSYSWPLVFSGMIATILTQIDSFAIGYYNNAAQVGIYNTAVPIASLLGVIPSLLIPLFFPIITKEFSRNNKELIKGLTKQFGKWVFIFNLPFFIIMIFFPGAIINLFFGPSYIAAENSLRLLSIGFLFYSIFIISENTLSMAGKTKIILLDITIASILNLVLNIIFVPKYGINGAALATMISYIVWGLLSFFQSNHYVSIIPIKRKMLKILLISIIPTILLFIIKQFIQLNKITLILQGCLFFLVYFLLIIITGCLDKNDWMIIETVKDKIRL